MYHFPNMNYSKSVKLPFTHFTCLASCSIHIFFGLPILLPSGFIFITLVSLSHSSNKQFFYTRNLFHNLWCSIQLVGLIIVSYLLYFIPLKETIDISKDVFTECKWCTAASCYSRIQGNEYT